MGKTGAILALILVAALFVPVVVAKQDEEDEFRVPDEWRGMKKVKIPHGELTQVVFIKYITGIGDPDEDQSQDGYILMDPILMWNLGRYPSGVPYVINPSTAVKRYGLSESKVVGAVKNSFEAWDHGVDLPGIGERIPYFDKVTATLPSGYSEKIPLYSNSPSINSKARVSINRPDGKNVVAWGAISDSGIIALSNIWYYPITGEIADADILMNTAHRWGIDPDGEGPIPFSGAFDIQNIMTHEVGHWCGLDDIYESTYSGMTMYGYGNLGEVKKISLEPGDVAGVQQVY